MMLTSISRRETGRAAPPMGPSPLQCLRALVRGVLAAFLLMPFLFSAAVQTGTAALPASPRPAGVVHHGQVPETRLALTPTTRVLTYAPVTNQWTRALLRQIPLGREFIHAHHLYRVTVTGASEMIPDVDVNKLTEADRTYDPAQCRFPDATDVVMVLGSDLQYVRHAMLGTLQPGIRVCFQGKAYDVRAGQSGNTLELVDTGIVAARVTRMFQHAGDNAADTIIDVTIRTADGKQDVLQATPIHPFYIPERKAYIELGKLTPGTHVQTADQGAATIVAMTTRKGTFDVYNLEVEGPHNYFVGDQKVLVHNKAANTGKPMTNWTLGRFKPMTKWQNQMAKRGWTNQQITEAIENGQAFNSRNAVNPGNSATRYIHPQTGRSVVIDNATGEIIHVGGDGFTYTHWDL